MTHKRKCRQLERRRQRRILNGTMDALQHTGRRLLYYFNGVGLTRRSLREHDDEADPIRPRAEELRSWLD